MCSLRVGIIADTQYVDSEDGTTFDKKTTRRYRHSLEILKRAVSYFVEEGVASAIHLGDVLDAKCKELDITARCCLEIKSVLEREASLKWNYVAGNHDLNCMGGRKRFDENFTKLGLHDRLYYHVSYPGYVFVYLDGYEVSTLAPSSEENKQKAIALLMHNNKNDVFGSNNSWFDGLTDEQKKYVPYNGAVSYEQLRWLETRAKQNGEGGVQETQRERHTRLLTLTHTHTHTHCSQHHQARQHRCNG